MRDRFNAFARATNDFVSSPAALVVAFAVVIVWAASGPFMHYSDAWQLIINTGTTIVTFLMVFVLNNAQSRDTAAMNTKLDAIIVGLANVDNAIAGVERKTEAEALAVRNDISAQIAAADA